MPSDVDLQPVMTVRSQVLAVQRKLVGDRVGYCLRDRIGALAASTAVVATGYAVRLPVPWRSRRASFDQRRKISLGRAHIDEYDRS